MNEDGAEPTCATCGSHLEAAGSACPNCGRLVGPVRPGTVFVIILGIAAGLIVNVVLGFAALSFTGAAPQSWLRVVLVIGFEAVFLGTLCYFGVRLVRRGRLSPGFFLVALAASAAVPTAACDVFYLAGFANHG